MRYRLNGLIDTGPLSSDELHFVLAHHWNTVGLSLSATDFTDAEAVAVLASSGRDQRHRSLTNQRQMPVKVTGVCAPPVRNSLMPSTKSLTSSANSRTGYPHADRLVLAGGATIAWEGPTMAQVRSWAGQRLEHARGKRRTVVAVARELAGVCWALARAD